MSNKIVLFFVTYLLQFALTYSRSAAPVLSDQQKIRNDIFNSINTHDGFLWKITPSEQNIQFIPLSAAVSINIFKLKYYYEGGIAEYLPKDEYLNEVYVLSNITDTLQKSSNVKLEVKNVIFYDQKNTSEQFLNDTKKYYHAELYNASFDHTDNATLLASINDWIANNTKNRAQKLNYLPTANRSYAQVSLLSYTACWDKPKTSANSIKTVNFQTPEGDIEIEAFNSKETIGYYNNSKSKYEAIRLPYKKNEFAIVIVLPYQNRSLKSLKDFSATRFRHLFDNVNVRKEHIDYTIPSINLPTMFLNENGTSVNGENPIICDSLSAQQTRVDEKKINYKRFYVDRPFGVYIYNVKTKIVLVHSLIKNPISNLSTVASSPGQSEDVILIQSSNLYEIFHMLV